MHAKTRGRVHSARVWLGGCCLFGLLTGVSQAQVRLYWDPLQTATGSGSGGSGTWHWGAPNNWYDGAASGNQAWVNNNHAVFGGIAGTVTPAGDNLFIHRMIFNTDGYVFAKSTYPLTFNGTGSPWVAPAIDLHTNTVLIRSVLAAGAALNINGHGTGRLTLTAENTRNSATLVNGATLVLDFSEADIDTNILADTGVASRVELHGATLKLIGRDGAVNSQSLTTAANSFSLRAGSAVVLEQNDATSLSLVLSGMSRNQGSTLVFTLPQNGGISSTLGTANTILLGQAGNVVPFATVGENDWAAKDAGNVMIVPGSSLAGFYTPSTADSLSGNADVASGVDTVITSQIAIDSLRFNQNEARTVTMSGTTLITLPGILVTPNVGNHETVITGGRIRGTSADLVVFQNNTAAGLTIGSQIINNNALTKSGPGLLTLTGSMTGNQPVYVNGGVLSVASNGSLGDPAVGASINISGGTLRVTETVALDDGAGKARSLIVWPKGAGIEVAAGRTLTVSGIISEQASYAGGRLTINGGTMTGHLLLTGTNTCATPSTLQGGQLTVEGGMDGPVTVADTAVLGGAGWIKTTPGRTAVALKAGGLLAPGSTDGIGTLEVTGDVHFSTGSSLRARANSDGTSSRMDVVGVVTADNAEVDVDLTVSGKGPWLIMTAEMIEPEFRPSLSYMRFRKAEGGTELWLYPQGGTTLLIR